LQGVSTRRVDELVQTLGLQGISKSQVSALCPDLDAEVERFRTRPLSGPAYPYVWLDATFVKARAHSRVVGQAVVIAIGLNAETGSREVLGLDGDPARTGRSGSHSCAAWSHVASLAFNSSSVTRMRA